MNGEVSTMPELPKGWVWTTIGEIYDIVGGGTPSTAVAGYWEGDIPWITSADIFGLRDIRPRRQITRQAIEGSATHLVPAGSLIIVTRVGLGKIALTSIPICFSQDSQGLVCGDVSPFPDYSLYCLSQVIQVFKYKHRGTTINGVTKKQLAELTFPVPPLNEQHRIIAKIEELFTRLDVGVEALKKIKAQLKRYRQSVLKHAFEGKLTAEWRQAHKDELEPASVLLERIKQERKKIAKYKDFPPPDTNDLPELPEGWSYLTLDFLVPGVRNAIRRGPFGSAIKKAFFVPSGYKVYEQGNVIYNDFDRGSYYIDENKFEEMKNFEVRPGDILMSCSGTVGKITIAPEGIRPGVINQALLKITLNNKIVDTSYFVYLFRSRVEEIMLANTRGSAMVNVSSVKDLRQIPFPISSMPEQHKIVEEIERHCSVADQIEKTVDHSLKQAERLRQSILKRAFEGRLVPQDLNDEPVEKLLERIKAARAKHLAEAKASSKSKKKTHTKQMRLV